MTTESYSISGSVVARSTQQGARGLTVSVALGDTLKESVITDDNGHFALEMHLELDHLNALTFSVLDASQQAISHRVSHSIVYDRIDAQLTFEVEQSRVIAADHEMIAGEIVASFAKTLPVAKLVAAHEYCHGGANELSNDLRLAFPQLASARDPDRRWDCTACAVRAPLQIAKSRSDFDWANFDKIHDFPLDKRGKVREFRGARVVIRYIPGAGRFGYVKDGDVLQPKTDARLGTIAPARIQALALVADDAINKFADMGLPSHKLWSETPLEIRLLRDTKGSGWTSVDVPYIVIYSELAPDLEHSVVPHEIFHRLQYALAPDSHRDDVALQHSIREGGARLAEVCIYDVPNRYISSAIGYFQRPDRGFFRADEAAYYATGLFWKYLAERFGQRREPPFFGADSYIDILRRIGPRGHTFPALRDAVQKTCGVSLTDAWFDFLVKTRLHNVVVVPDLTFEDECESVAQDGDTTYKPLAETTVDCELVDISELKRSAKITTTLGPWAARFHDITIASEQAGSLVITRLDRDRENIFVCVLHVDACRHLSARRQMTEESSSLRFEVATKDRILLVTATVESGGAAQLMCHREAPAAER